MKHTLIVLGVLVVGLFASTRGFAKPDLDQWQNVGTNAYTYTITGVSGSASTAKLTGPAAGTQINWTIEEINLSETGAHANVTNNTGSPVTLPSGQYVNCHQTASAYLKFPAAGYASGGFASRAAAHKVYLPTSMTTGEVVSETFYTDVPEGGGGNIYSGAAGYNSSQLQFDITTLWWYTESPTLPSNVDPVATGPISLRIRVWW